MRRRGREPCGPCGRRTVRPPKPGAVVHPTRRRVPVPVVRGPGWRPRRRHLAGPRREPDAGGPRRVALAELLQVGGDGLERAGFPTPVAVVRWQTRRPPPSAGSHGNSPPAAPAPRLRHQPPGRRGTYF